MRTALEFYFAPPLRKLSKNNFVLILIQFTTLLESITVTRRTVSGWLKTNWKVFIIIIIIIIIII